MDYDGADEKSNACTSQVECSDNRNSSPAEERLSQLLLERVAPSFTTSLKLQALVVYQADHGNTKCLLVDRDYRRSSEFGLDADHPDTLENSFALLSDSGFVDNVSPNPSPAKLDQPATDLADSPNSAVLSSRRKRKLCRPCKIPIDGANDAKPSACESVLPQPLPEESSLPVVTSVTCPTTIPLTSKEQTSSNGNTLTEGMVLPVSAVTLLPSLGVFSLPITVLSALPRPILPRTVNEQLPATYSIIQTSAPMLTAHPQASTLDRPTTMAKPDEIKVVIPSSTSDNNRRLGKSFICNQCRKEFASLNLLCAHTFSVHRGFRCTICRAQFTQRSNLQRHSLRHVGFKPFVCKICEKSYYRKDHLVRHIELAHPGCDPRVSLTVKLSSAECLDYLDKIQHSGLEAEQAQLLYQAPNPDKSPTPPTSSSNPVTLSNGIASAQTVVTGL